MQSLMTPIGAAALMSREGVRLAAYLDTQGVWTIGYGHTKGVTRGMVITQAQATAWFYEDLASHALPIVSAIKVPVADHERDALISIAFNIGVGGFVGSTFLRKLNAGDRAGCAAAIMQWTKNKELVSRRTAERDQFLTPYTTSLPKARSTDARPVAAPLSSGAAPISTPTPSVPTQPRPVPIPPTSVPSTTPPAPAQPKGFWSTILSNLRAGFPPNKGA